MADNAKQEPEDKTPKHPMAKYLVADYEPHFDRGSTTRRVLGHVTDDDHVGRGGRNTVDRLFQELVEDPHTRTVKTTVHEDGTVDRVDWTKEDAAAHLDKLVDARLLEQRDDGTYGVTHAGMVELVN